MDRLLTGMAIFVEYPVLALVIGVFLVLVGRRTRHPTAVLVGMLWTVYAAYEFGMKRRWLCSGECDIRIDLLLIYPVLAIGLLVALITLFRPSRTSRP
jgi:hypothetical protein